MGCKGVLGVVGGIHTWVVRECWGSGREIIVVCTLPLSSSSRARIYEKCTVVCVCVN